MIDASTEPKKLSSAIQNLQEKPLGSIETTPSSGHPENPPAFLQLSIEIMLHVYHEASTPQSHNHDHDWSSQATLNFRFLRFTGFLYFSPVGTTLLPLRGNKNFKKKF